MYPLDKGKIKKILVIMSRGTIGDALLSTPLFHNLKIEFPNAYLVGMLRESIIEVFQGNPFVDELQVIPNKYLGGIRNLKEQIEEIRTADYDLAIFLNSSFREAVLLHQAKIPIRIGPAGRLFYSFLFTHRVTHRSDVGDVKSHQVEIFLDYMRVLGIEPRNRELFFHVPDEDKKYVDDLLKEIGIKERDFLIGFNPTKEMPLTFIQWPAKKFAAFGQALSAYFKAKVVFTGTTREIEIVESIEDYYQGEFYTLAGKLTTKQLGAFISKCDLFVSPESGAMHLAAVLKVPVVGIFGIRSEKVERLAPYNCDHEIVRLKEIPCHGWCVKETCRHFHCYEAIPDSMLIKAAANIISRTRRKDRKTAG